MESITFLMFITHLSFASKDIKKKKKKFLFKMQLLSKYLRYLKSY